MENMIRSNASINDQVEKLSNNERDISVKVSGVRRTVRAKNPQDAVEKLTAQLEDENKDVVDGAEKKEK